MAMQIKPEDRIKAIGLIAAIVAVFAFIAFRVLGNAKPAATTGTGNVAASEMPSTASIAEGQIVAKNDTTKPTAENLHEVFAGAGGIMPAGSPFREPVPAPKIITPQQTGGGVQTPTQGQPDRKIDVDGEFRPVQPDGIGGDAGTPGAPQVESGGLLVKGIIAPRNGDAPLAFIQIGERGKGFRIGDQIAPGMKVVGISSTKVSVKIGGTVANFGVGQEVKPG